MRYIFFSIISHIVASIFLKYGAIRIIDFNLITIISNGFYGLSLFFLFLQAIFWQLSLKNYSLNYAYMFNSLYYPFLLLISYSIFNEQVTIGNIAGTVFITIGIIVSKKI